MKKKKKGGRNGLKELKQQLTTMDIAQDEIKPNKTAASKAANSKDYYNITFS